MSVFKKQSLIESFPAYDVFKREAITAFGSGVEAIEVTSDDILGRKFASRRGSFYRTYRPGSVVSYALEYNEDPIDAVKDAVKNGHALHWLNQQATVLTSHPVAKKALVAIEVGTVIRFEGRYFTIVAEANDNLGLKPL